MINKGNKMRILYLQLFFLLLVCQGINAQAVADTTTVEKLFFEQITHCPQEKAYVQTDKAYYVSGEDIWFRIHLVDALLLRQANASRYTYIELINPAKEIVKQQKIKADSLGCFYGNIKLDEDLPEGNYSLRAYTRYMQNQGEDYILYKSVYIADPRSKALLPKINFSFKGEKVDADIYFVDKTDNTQIVPDKCFISKAVGTNKDENKLSFREKVAHYSFKREDKGGVFLLKTVYGGHTLNQYINIPSYDKDFDVSFFPEGGHIPFSTDAYIAFKALNGDGLSEDVKGQIIDDRGEVCTTFESSHLGMGHFRMYYMPGRTYHAICTNQDNVSKRFELPQALENSVSLKTMWSNNHLRVTLAKSPNYKLPQLQLVAHVRGVVLYEQPWDEGSGYINFDKNFFPAGIIHFLLIDRERNILSERLAFSAQSSTFAKTNTVFDKAKYDAREKINMTIEVTDENKVPLNGNLSLSVIDQKSTIIDTTSTILSSLLLSSELKGYIESPNSYFKKDDIQSTLALDILMMTQGWRRYDVANILKGKITKDLPYPLESDEEVTGRVKGLFTSLKEGSISLVAMKDSVIGTSLTQPDNKGRFVFKNMDYPDGTKYIVQALTKKDKKNVFIELDPQKSFPVLPTLKSYIPQRTSIEDERLSETNEEKATKDNMRTYNLEEVVVTTNRRKALKTKSVYYSLNSSKVLTGEDAERINAISVLDLLRQIPGLTVIGNEVRHRNMTPMVILDNVPEDNFDYDRINVSDISDVFLSPPISVMPIFGGRASGGAIVINTKKGFVERNRMNSNIQVCTPIGYQQAVEFYSPKYLTQEERDSNVPDLRTTIYWNPRVKLDNSGRANISFYAADLPTQYGVILEGVSSEGHIVHYSIDKGITIETKK